MKKRSWLMTFAACAAAMAVCAGCGSDDTIGGKLVDEVHGGNSSSSHASESLTGTWSGNAGTGQSRTVLQLEQNGSSLSGSWMWGAHDTRYCSGYRSGNHVVLKDTRSDGDTWSLTLSPDRRSLSGTGNKYGGGSYAVHFIR